jgi:hypothetical protein
VCNVKVDAGDTVLLILNTPQADGANRKQTHPGRFSISVSRYPVVSAYRAA